LLIVAGMPGVTQSHVQHSARRRLKFGIEALHREAARTAQDASATPLHCKIEKFQIDLDATIFTLVEGR
jgi:hypothetical protein